MDEYKPITGELRGAGRESDVYHVESDTVDRTVIFDGDRFDDLCDNIDAVHAQLERDYKAACEVNERQDADYVDLKRENESLRKKVKHQSAQLSEIQGALERRNEGVLKQRWQKELDRLKAERDSMAAALDAAQGEHAFAPESHYMILPKDADGVPIHVGDVMEGTCPSGKHVSGEVLSIGDDKLWLSNVQFSLRPSYMRHHVPDTWERIIMDAVCGGDEDELVARCKRLAGQS